MRKVLEIYMNYYECWNEKIFPLKIIKSQTAVYIQDMDFWSVREAKELEHFL